LFDRTHSSVGRILAETGGVRPPARCRSPLVLTLAEREEISRAVVARRPIRSIAVLLGRSPSTISRAIQRNGGLGDYRAARAPAFRLQVGADHAEKAKEERARPNLSPGSRPACAARRHARFCLRFQPVDARLVSGRDAGSRIGRQAFFVPVR
jgi:hypothetical protein